MQAGPAQAGQGGAEPRGAGAVRQGAGGQEQDDPRGESVRGGEEVEHPGGPVRRAQFVEPVEGDEEPAADHREGVEFGDDAGELARRVGRRQVDARQAAVGALGYVEGGLELLLQ